MSDNCDNALTLAGLATVPRWVAWQLQTRKGGPTKVPKNPKSGGNASVDEPQTWGTRQAAEALAARLPKPHGTGGIGIVLGVFEKLAIGGIDLDTCRNPETGDLAPWAQDVVDRFGAYAETSPSLTGVKLFFRYTAEDLETLQREMGTKTGKKYSKEAKGGHPEAIELYLTGRFFTVTEMALDGSPPELRHVPIETLQWLLREAGPALEATGSSNTKGSANGSASGGRDKSRSARAMAAAARERRRGATYEQMKAALLDDPETAEWTREKGLAGGERELRRMWDKVSARYSGQGANRPTIRVVAGELPDAVDQAEKALLAADLGIYTRGSFIVRTAIVRIAVADNRHVVAQRIVEVGDHAMVEALTLAAGWEKYDGRAEDWVTINAPMNVVKAYRERVGRWRLPVLAGIVNAPTLRPDGTVLAQPGYDAATGLVLDTGGASFPDIPPAPTIGAARLALDQLKDLLRDFPFVAPADRAVALSALLTACCRRALPTAPLHGFTAPTAGSGKSMLVDLCSILATGREAGVIAQGKTEEETEKRLGALLLAGDPVVAIDNCEAPLGGEFLCQVMTQPVVRARILGRSEAPELPSNAFISATGNNLVLAGDMTRRGLLCSLDPKCERPELRRFDRNPTAMAKADRGKYVVAALTVLRAYWIAGRPQQRDPLGSFEEWSRTVRDALVWLGEADPVETMEKARALDPRLEAVKAVFTQWREVIGTDQRVTVREVIDRATEMRTPVVPAYAPTPKPEFAHPDFREALLHVAGDGGAINGKRLGKWLLAQQGRIVEGCRVEQAGLYAGLMTWKLAQSRQEMPRAA